MAMPSESAARGGRRVYLDNAASCLTVDACRAAWADFDARPWAGANPNSLHHDGREAFKALESARAELARALGAQRPSEVTFTSGGTESNNAAVLGLAHAARERSRGARTRVLVSAVEHDSVLALRPRLAGEGLSLETVPVLPDGTLDLAVLRTALEPGDVALVSVMAANNEVGAIQPLAEVVRLAHQAGALVHTDAVQMFGHAPLRLHELGVDAASVTAHKLGGPVGVGALYLRARTQMRPLLVGGGQEAGLRAGTVDVRGAVAFAAVARDAVEHLAERRERVREVARVIVEGLTQGPAAPARLAAGPQAADSARLPGIVSLIVAGHQTQGLILALDDAGYSVAGGSACSSGSLDPSHVLSAMGVPREEALCALRVSFDHRVTPDDAHGFVEALRRVCGVA